LAARAGLLSSTTGAVLRFGEIAKGVSENGNIASVAPLSGRRNVFGVPVKRVGSKVVAPEGETESAASPKNS